MRDQISRLSPASGDAILAVFEIPKESKGEGPNKN